jgi:regulator of sigma E protease
MDLLFTVAMFVVAVGVLITVHEFGHFWVARRTGIRIHKFSIGFGPALASRTGRDGVEYVIAALPLGGFVKMAGEVPGEDPDLPPEEQHRAYAAKPVPVRMAVAAAGPVANFLLAAVAFIVILLLGMRGVVPQVGYVAAESPAAVAGLQTGDRLRAVGGSPVASWQEARMALMDAAMGRDRVPVTVERGGAERRLRLDLSGLGAGEIQKDFLYEGIGLAAYFPIRVARVQEDSPAARADIGEGDRIQAVNGEPVASWQRFVAVVQAHPQQPLELKVAGAGGDERTVTVRPERVEGPDGKPMGRVGLSPAPLPEELQVVVRKGPLDAVTGGVGRMISMTGFTVEMLGRMVTGSVSADNLGGPVAIAQFAGQSAAAGLVPFLWFLGMISISLGVLNLLPIPVLDGGHLLFQAIEGIRGRPLAEDTLIRWQQVGIVLLVGIMLFALLNDLKRLFG